MARLKNILRCFNQATFKMIINKDLEYTIGPMVDDFKAYGIKGNRMVKECIFKQTELKNTEFGKKEKELNGLRQ